jgi:uncharacterized protein YdhG (YjbR/CyaY superfamily)
MKKVIAPPETVNEYLKLFPSEIRKKLQQLRQSIKKAAPKAEETISYQMPAYKYFGMLVYFAAWKNHIGFYPGAGGIKEFQKELSGYKGAKGSIQFPNDKPLPLGLISKIVKFRVKQNEVKQKSKK